LDKSGWALKITGNITDRRMRRVNSLFGNGPNGWNEQLVHAMFLPHDAEEIMKIKVPIHDLEDTIAWHYEKNGKFTVRSAYRLASSINSEPPPSSSKAPSGTRKIWNKIWIAPVPNKVCIFSWCLACDNLPTQRNKWRRTLEVQNTCNICGIDTEDSHHVVVQCTKAKALRAKMREFWTLPDENAFSKSEDDWLLILLDNTKKEMHQGILLTLWRSWHLRNNIVHDKGDATIEQSAKFLLSYVKNLNSNEFVDAAADGDTVLIPHTDR
jgi:hypothetical protein